MRNKKTIVTFEPLLRVGIIFGAVGGLLFARVWWPIQAERSRTQLQRVETQVFQRKAELNSLNERYADLTSLTILDQWAKRHGPWVSPNAENVLPIQ